MARTRTAQRKQAQGKQQQSKQEQGKQEQGKQEQDKTAEAYPPQPRPFWSGVIAFGLVSLPVSLFPAHRGKMLSLRMVDREGMPLTRRYFCEKEGKVLDKSEIVRGYPIDKQEYILVEDEELEALAPEKSREIDLRRFVPIQDVDPIFFERSYYLAPDSGATKAYRLLVQSMRDERRVGIATFVMRDKEYLITIMAEAGLLTAQTLRFHDEIRTPETVGLPEPHQADREEVERVGNAMDRLYSKTLDRSQLVDRESRRILERVEAKRRAGEDVVQEPEGVPLDEDTTVVDIMQVLKQRLQGESSSTSREQAPEEHRENEIDSLNRDQLYQRARELGISGRSKMSRKELVEALKHAG